MTASGTLLSRAEAPRRARARTGFPAREGRAMLPPGIFDDGTSYHVHTHPSPVEHWRHLLEIIALVVAAAWAFYVFIYQERIKPAGQPAFIVAIAPTVSHSLVGGNTEFVSVTLNFQNKGGTAADMAGLAINVFGVRFLGASRTRTETIANAPGNFDVSSTLQTTAPVLLHSYYRVWRPFGGVATRRLPPGLETQISFWFGIPRGQYNVVSIAYRYCFTRADDPRTYHAKPVHHSANGPFWLPQTFANDVPNAQVGYRCLLASSVENSDGYPL